MLGEFGLRHLRDHGAYSLSGGERRRLEIARALCADPKIILLDEPFTGIDPIAVGEVQDLVVGLKFRGIGVLITDHNVLEALRITDRAYILSEGHVVTHGTAQEILEDPIARESYLGDRIQAGDIGLPGNRPRPLPPRPDGIGLRKFLVRLLFLCFLHCRVGCHRRSLPCPLRSRHYRLTSTTYACLTPMRASESVLSRYLLRAAGGIAIAGVRLHRGQRRLVLAGLAHLHRHLPPPPAGRAAPTPADLDLAARRVAERLDLLARDFHVSHVSARAAGAGRR